MYIKQWINNKLQYIFSSEPQSSQDIIPQRLLVKIQEAKEKKTRRIRLKQLSS